MTKMKLREVNEFSQGQKLGTGRAGDLGSPVLNVLFLKSYFLPNRANQITSLGVHSYDNLIS